MKALDQQLVKVALALYQGCASEVADSCAEKLKSNDLLGLVSMAVDPKDYSDATRFERDYVAVGLLKKTPFDIPGVDRADAARKIFFESEQKCASTNTRFHRFLNNHFDGVSELRCVEFLDVAKRWIRDVLGRLPDDIEGRFGPGATFNDRGLLTTVPDKMTSTPSITPEARCLLQYYYETWWYKARVADNRQTEPECVRGNRFTTVPKDALKDRGICIEPSLNVFLQLGVGKFIRRRLKSRAKLDLSSQWQLHRQWACDASRDGLRATIDLSSASDTVAYQFVRYMLPAEWFALLDCLRSPFTHVDGKWMHNQKFSSMGNGFTFELETLLFASLCFAAGCGECGVDYSVFGDDIIVPTGRAVDVVALLKFCGFSENKKKTFLSGKFRESCGGDFFDGRPVRPYFLKEIPHEPQHWIKMANGIRRLGRSDSGRWFRFSYPFTAWLRCLDALPSSIRRLRGPESLGDTVIHDEEFERTWKDGIGYVRAYLPIGIVLPWHNWTDDVMLATMLYGADSSGVMPRGKVSGYRIGKVPFS